MLDPEGIKLLDSKVPSGASVDIAGVPVHSKCCRKPLTTRGKVILFASIGALAFCGVILVSVMVYASQAQPRELAHMLDLPSLLKRLSDLQDIADQNNGNRAAGYPGCNILLNTKVFHV